MSDPAEEAERLRQLHGLEMSMRKQPREPGQPPPDPVHVIRMNGDPEPGTDQYWFCRWSLAARLVRDAHAAGAAGQVEDLGPDALIAAATVDPAQFGNGTLLVHVGTARDGRWLKWTLATPPEPVPGTRPWGAPRN